MKIVAVMGTHRKNGAGAGYVKQLELAFAGEPGVEFEYVWLGDCCTGLCRGCMVCYERGEAACPLKDGYAYAMGKLNAADAAVFYSPTYALSISGTMKNFLDRSSYVLHRPYFKGRHALVLTAVAAYGHKQALHMLKTIVALMGFAVAGSTGIMNGRYDVEPLYRARIGRRLKKQAMKLMERAGSARPVNPSLYELVVFNIQKAFFGTESDGCRYDKQYWKNAGWADKKTGYYCQARISPVKRLLGRVLARVAIRSGIVAQ